MNSKQALGVFDGSPGKAQGALQERDLSVWLITVVRLFNISLTALWAKELEGHGHMMRVFRAAWLN